MKSAARASGRVAAARGVEVGCLGALLLMLDRVLVAHPTPAGEAEQRRDHEQAGAGLGDHFDDSVKYVAIVISAVFPSPRRLATNNEGCMWT